MHNAVCAIAPDTQEVTVTWSKPESACPITGYELSWQNDAEQPFASINASTVGPSLSHTTTLHPGDEKTVCVAAMLEEERGLRTCCVEVPPKHSGKRTCLKKAVLAFMW